VAQAQDRPSAVAAADPACAIQRALVWTNEQIINYWDSLLRGYPPGLMMVHEAHSTPLKPDQGYDTDGKPDRPDAGDYQLFDGQQRMAALLLGIGEGPLHRHLRLWIAPTRGLRVPT